MEKIPSNIDTAWTPERYRGLAERLSGRSESFKFPGIKEEHYVKMKAESEEFPGLATHIDVLIERFKNEGMRVVVEGADAFILPFLSDDVENDSVLPRRLNIDNEMDSDLKELIEVSQILKKK